MQECERQTERDVLIACTALALYNAVRYKKRSFTVTWVSSLASTETFAEIVPGEPSVGELNARGVAKYSDFGPIEGYISETLQGRR